MKQNNLDKSAQTSTQKFQFISKKIEQLSQSLVGRIGLAAQEIGSEDRLIINGDEAFVMASTFKVAIAVCLLDLVDKGQLNLSDLIDISPEMIVAGDNVIAQNLVHQGIKLSLANLIENSYLLSQDKPPI